MISGKEGRVSEIGPGKLRQKRRMSQLGSGSRGILGSPPHRSSLNWQRCHPRPPKRNVSYIRLCESRKRRSVSIISIQDMLCGRPFVKFTCPLRTNGRCTGSFTQRYRSELIKILSCIQLSITPGAVARVVSGGLCKINLHSLFPSNSCYFSRSQE